MVRQPTGFFADTAGLFETVQPVPLHERRTGTQQTIPGLAWHSGNLAYDLYHQFVAHRSDPIMMSCLIKLLKIRINPPGGWDETKVACVFGSWLKGPCSLDNPVKQTYSYHAGSYGRLQPYLQEKPSI